MKGRGRSERLFSLLYVERAPPKSPRVPPSSDHELRAHFTAELSGGGIASATEKLKKRSGGTETAYGGEGAL